MKEEKPRHAVKTVVRDPDATKRRILAAVRDLLVSRGFQDLALDDVAKQAGVAKGTLFLHFADKDALFAAAFADLVDALGLELEALPRTGVEGKDLLLAAARVVLGHFERNRDFMAQFSTGRFPGCGDRSCGKLMERMRGNLERMRKILAKADADGGAGRDLEFAAAAFFGLCRSATFRRMLTDTKTSLERDAEGVVAFFLDGSGVRP